jgi:hypothetical protein
LAHDDFSADGFSAAFFYIDLQSGAPSPHIESTKQQPGFFMPFSVSNSGIIKTMNLKFNPEP